MSENITNQTEELELSAEQCKRCDEIHEATLAYCRILCEAPELEWNMSFIGEIADFAADCMVRHGIGVRYPSIVSDKDGTRHIEDYVNGFVDDPEDNRCPF